nr:GH116 family glycosyl hydrolase [Candidatus Njordarchaeum guaymaensis]
MKRTCGCTKGNNNQSSDCCSSVPSEKVLRNVSKPLSGIPLGGIGTGSVELRADGRFYEWQIFNNPPWSGGSLLIEWKGEEILDPDDFYFAIRVKAPDSEPKVRILASKEKSDVDKLYVGSYLKNVEGIEYIGEFPFVKINYKTDLPVEARLDAFSPFIPLDVKNSALPAAVLTFTVRNVSTQRLEISVLGGMVNPIGRDVRNSEAVNKITANNDFTSIEMSAKNIPEDHYQYLGSLALTCLQKEQQRLTYRANQPVVPELTGSGESGEDYWKLFRVEGELDNKDRSQPPFLARVLQGFPDLAKDMSKFANVYVSFPKEFQKFIEASLVSNMPEFEEATSSDLTLQSDPRKRWLFILEWIMKHNPIMKKQYEEIISKRPEVERDHKEKQKVLEKLVPPPRPMISIPKLKGPQGLLCSKISLDPEKESKVTFILTWFFPNHVSSYGSEKMGHMYENWFSNAPEVNEYIMKNLDQLRERSKGFHDALYESNFDYWLIDAINAQLTTFVKSSFYVKDGRFGIWEGIGCCGLQTLDVTYYGSHPVLLFFPELQKSQMKLTAQFQLTPESRRYHEYFVAFPKNKKLFEQRTKTDPSILTNKEKRLEVYKEIITQTGQDATGRIPHMFPGALNAVDAYHMIDLMPKFALLVLRDYLWTGDKKYLEEMWKHVKAAMNHNLSTDEHGTLLPYHYDRSLTDTYIASQTYDAWDFLGYSAYVSSIWLAALKATKKIAQVLGDETYAKKMDEVYTKARTNMEKMLWNGEYYNLWHDPPSGKTNYYCMADQLNGQWYANFLKLGDILEKDHIKSVLKAIFKYNYLPEAGLLNGALPERFEGKGVELGTGMGVVSGWHQRDNPWTGTEYAVASLLIQEGFVKEGLTIVKNVYDRYQQAGLTWNHIECGGHYYRAMDIWAVLTDLEGLVYNAVERELAFEPRMNEDDFKSVYVLPTAWGAVTQSQQPASQSNMIKVNEGNLAIGKLLIKTPLGRPDVKLQKGSTKIVVKQVKHERGSLEIELKETANIKAGETLQIKINSL